MLTLAQSTLKKKLPSFVPFFNLSLSSKFGVPGDLLIRPGPGGPGGGIPVVEGLFPVRKELPQVVVGLQ